MCSRKSPIRTSVSYLIFTYPNSQTNAMRTLLCIQIILFHLSDCFSYLSGLRFSTSPLPHVFQFWICPCGRSSHICDISQADRGQLDTWEGRCLMKNLKALSLTLALLSCPVYKHTHHYTNQDALQSRRDDLQHISFKVGQPGITIKSLNHMNVSIGKVKVYTRLTKFCTKLLPPLDNAKNSIFSTSQAQPSDMKWLGYQWHAPLENLVSSGGPIVQHYKHLEMHVAVVRMPVQ